METEVIEKEETPAAVPENVSRGAKRVAAKKKRRKIIRVIVIAVIVAAAAFAAWKFFGGGGEADDAVAATDFVQYGSITSMVEGSGLTKAKNSETITLTTAGTVMDVFVTEGQEVAAGEALFTVDSPAAETAVEKARTSLEGYEKQLASAEKDIAGLNLAPTYAGKLFDTVKLNPGDTVTKGEKVATLADDTSMRLVQYYSYAYEDDITVGQTMTVSVPALISTVEGKVERVNKVNRITEEGSRLFSVDVVIENPGVLTAGMIATATAAADGEAVYPYEAGKLEYYRVGDLCSTVTGTVISSRLVDYLSVSAGETLVSIDGEDSENEIFTIKQSLEAAKEELRLAEENLANCSAVAPIDGTVIGLSLIMGEEVAANTPVVTISDTKTITVTATVDERNISYIKKGMTVDLDQWGNAAMGTVESVSLSSTVSNGVATYPITISVDNYEGLIQVNSYISYSLMASQSENCLVVPLQAVRTVALEDGSSATVVYVAGERPENAVDGVISEEEIPEGFWPVTVEIGISDNYNVEIKSGVEEGAEVFTQMMTQEAWG